MDSLHTINGKPVEATAAPAQNIVTLQNSAVTAGPSTVTHKDECGIVGEVGIVGDLGSNAKS